MPSPYAKKSAKKRSPKKYSSPKSPKFHQPGDASGAGHRTSPTKKRGVSWSSTARKLGNWAVGRAANYLDPTGLVAAHIPQFKNGGMVKRTGPAIVHRGEYITNPAASHPWKTAVVNPFAVSGGCRIPDETAYETFCVVQTGSFLVTPPPTLAAGQATFAGMRLRPSMADGTSKTDTAMNTTIIGDAINPCLQTNTGGVIAYEWQSAAVAGPVYIGPSTSTVGTEEKVTYLWGPANNANGASGFNWTSSVNNVAGTGTNNNVALPSTAQYGTIPGPMGYALQQGSTCRPTAWGIRIRYAGLQNTATNINPYGRLFFGIHTPESEGNEPGQTDFDTQPVYDGTRTATGVYSGGPGNPLLVANMVNDAMRGKVGIMTMDELRARPHGIVIATGPRSTSERLFRDVDFYTGQDRVTDSEGLDNVWYYQQDAQKRPVVTSNQITTVKCSQPWFFLEQGTNITIHVEYMVQWEVVPSATAYTLPGSLKSEPSNTMQMDGTANVMAYAAANPAAAAEAAGR